MTGAGAADFGVAGAGAARTGLAATTTGRDTGRLATTTGRDTGRTMGRTIAAFDAAAGFACTGFLGFASVGGRPKIRNADAWSAARAFAAAFVAARRVAPRAAL